MGKEIAYCGLNCDTCIVKITIKNEGREGLDRLAKEWSTPENQMTGNDLYCDTYCTSTDGTLPGYCSDCEIRNCGIKNKVNNCGECKSYPCELINKRVPSDSEQRKMLDGINKNFKL